jgi:hypothetical protein
MQGSVITDEASPFALRSTRNRLRRAMRRGALGLANGATEQAPGSAVGSLARAGTSPSPSADGADHRSTVRRPNGQPGSRDRPGSLSGMPFVSRSPCPRTRSLHASGVQCPVSGVTVQCPRMRCPRVGCPMSGCVEVRCPASVSARSASASRCVRTGELVELVGAAGSHMVRRGVWIWPSCRIRERLDHLPEPAWLRVRDCLASHRTGSSGWRRRLRSVVTV